MANSETSNDAAGREFDFRNSRRHLHPHCKIILRAKRHEYFDLEWIDLDNPMTTQIAH